MTRTAELTEKLLAGVLSDAEAAELESLVAADPRAEVEYLALLELEATLRGLRADFDLAEPTLAKVEAAQAEQFVRDFGDYEDLVIKVPVGWDELEVIAALRRNGIKVNCTCCMSYNQAVIAAQAGANYVSLFWGRIRDTGYDASAIVRQVRASFREWGCPSEIIVGSIRQMMDINEAMRAGADIVTVPPPFLPKLCQHPKTDEAVAQFIHDFQAWQTPDPALAVPR